MNKVIAVDFDGTLCRSKWPDIGDENSGLIQWLIACQKNGDKIILFTCREGMLLRAALMWCTARGLKFDAVNENLPERIAQYGGDCRKISADIYLDDRAIGVYYPPRQSEFFVQGTDGLIMKADVELTSQESAESARPEGGKPPTLFPMKKGKTVLPVTDGIGYQYRPGKPRTFDRIRGAWRVLRGKAKA